MAFQDELSDLALEGERVLLRPVREGDAPRAFSALHGRDEVLAWLVWEGPRSLEELQGSYRAWLAQDAEGPWLSLAIVERASLVFRGALTLRPGAGGSFELGYWIEPEAWGRGLASEAVGLALWLAFEELGARQVGACVFEGNLASARVLEKNGFQRAPPRCEASPPPGEERAAAAARRPQQSFLLERAAWLRRPGRVRPRAARVLRRGEDGTERAREGNSAHGVG